MKRLIYLTVLFSIYALMILRWGYEFGRNDQMQTLSYANYLSGQASYEKDFYIQGIHEHVPNERFIFSRIISPAIPFMQSFSFVCHLLLALILIHLILRFSATQIRAPGLQFLIPLILFIPLYGFGLGGNELYYNSFFVSNLVKVAVLWAFWMMYQQSQKDIKGRLEFSFAIFGLATFLQPVVGIQSFGMGLGAMLFSRIFRQAHWSWTQIIRASSVWLLSGGIWVAFLKLNFEADPLQGEDHFFEILFNFRAPHHYMPSSWPLSTWIIQSLMTIWGAFYWNKKSSIITGFYFAAILAMLLAFPGVVVLKSTSIAALQAYKMTIWLELFNVIAILAALQKLFGFLELKNWKRFTYAMASLSGIVASAILLSLASQNKKLPWDVPLDFPFPNRISIDHPRDDASDVALHAASLSDENALFAHPIGFTELKFYGQRSSFVDYKVLVHTRQAMHEWMRRIELLYGLNWESEKEEITASRYERADKFYHDLILENPQELREAGIEYLIANRKYLASDLFASGKSVYQNETWAILKIAPPSSE
jgi:hypothetical protein